MRNRVVSSSSVRGGKLELARLCRVALKFMLAMKLDRAELSLTLVTDAQIRKLNRAWRKKDKATDVLSFPNFLSGNDAPALPGSGGRLLGDVVISLETARRVARAQGVALRSELNLYLAHGLLHLLGHDHHRVADRKAMAREESRLLGTSGMLTRQ